MVFQLWPIMEVWFLIHNLLPHKLAIEHFRAMNFLNFRKLPKLQNYHHIIAKVEKP